jgi:hypothetical protein
MWRKMTEPPLRMGTDGPDGRAFLEGEIGPGGVVKKMKFVVSVRSCRVRICSHTYSRSF